MPAGLQPRVYVHKDVNPPQNPKGLLQNNEILMWEADIGGQPTTMIFENNSWRTATPQEIQQYVPPAEAPQPPPAAPVATDPLAPQPQAPAAAPQVGAGSAAANPHLNPHSVKGRADAARAKREGELQDATAVEGAQKAGAAKGEMGAANLSIAERGRANTLMTNEGMTEDEAIAQVVGERKAAPQADALEQE